MELLHGRAAAGFCFAAAGGSTCLLAFLVAVPAGSSIPFPVRAAAAICAGAANSVVLGSLGRDDLSGGRFIVVLGSSVLVLISLLLSMAGSWCWLANWCSPSLAPFELSDLAFSITVVSCGLLPVTAALQLVLCLKRGIRHFDLSGVRLRWKLGWTLTCAGLCLAILPLADLGWTGWSRVFLGALLASAAVSLFGSAGYSAVRTSREGQGARKGECVAYAIAGGVLWLGGSIALVAR